jgi:hypothetical protein
MRRQNLVLLQNLYKKIHTWWPTSFLIKVASRKGTDCSLTQDTEEETIQNAAQNKEPSSSPTAGEVIHSDFSQRSYKASNGLQ